MDNEDAAHITNDPGPERLAQVFAHATTVVIGTLPAPRPDTAAARAARDMNAIAQIAALVPANAAEVMVGVQFVTAGAQGVDCLRRMEALADPVEARRTAHQAASLMRVSQGAANVLLRLQAARLRREATSEAATSAALTEHCAMQLMVRALVAKAAADAEAAERAAAAQAERAARQALPPPPAPEPEPVTAEHLAAAEAYAQSNPSNLNRARIMRRKRGMPNWGMFTPPEPEVVNAIVHGHSAFLDTLLPGPTGG